MPFIPFPEYRPDVNDFRADYTNVLSGVLPRGDGWGPFPDLQAYTAALGSQCFGFFYSRRNDGTIRVFAGTDKRLYLLDNTALTWSDVSKGATDYSTLSSGHNWQFAQYGAYVIAVQANTAPQYFDIETPSTAFADLGGSPPNAAYVAAVNQFLVLSGLTSYPKRVQWSGLNAVTTWTPGTTYSNYFDFPDGGVTRGLAGGEFGIATQEGVVRRMVYVPGATLAFQWERVSEELGQLYPYSTVRAGQRIFFLSALGFVEVGGAGPIVQIGKERVDRTVLADIDGVYPGLVIGAADPAGTRAFWAYKSIRSGTTTAFDTVIAYDYGLDRWSPPISISGEYLAAMIKPGKTLEGLDSVSSDLDALGFSLDSVQASLASKLSAATTAHKVGFFDGSNLEAILETSEQAQEPPQRIYTRWIRPRTDAAGVYGSVRYRENPDDNLSQTSETAANDSGRCPVRIDTAMARSRIRVPAGTNWTYALGVEPNFAITGGR